MSIYTSENLVSIIVPVYNAEKYLARCIKSILRQSYCNFELLLVDDGSGDHSLEICRKFKETDARIIVITQPNKGVSAARNHGLDEARGQYICFVDSDDWIDTDHIEKLVLNMKTSDCVCEGYIGGQSINRLENKRIDLLHIDGQEMYTFFANGLVHVCWNKMFKKDIIDCNKIRFPLGANISEDSLFCLEYLMNAETLILSENCTYHYWNDSTAESLSKKINDNAIEIYRQVYFSIKNMLVRGNCQKEMAESILNRTVFPQLYNVVIKVAKSDLGQKDKRRYFDNIVFADYSKTVLTLKNASVPAEKLTVMLIKCRQYRLLEYLWKKIIK